ncbi:hypothetical protein MtrunA17_Chr4g0043581 [Medicago truncatula]|uniref:Uncharacterized protein n=1 Tax=Medicago truncatula TaxID=3880 RepID=A0A396IEE8_MEDTR|nr:hypothetical protein MtrunA17_Chr4g0043581 [Medicago truncatula]
MVDTTYLNCGYMSSGSALITIINNFFIYTLNVQPMDWLIILCYG